MHSPEELAADLRGPDESAAEAAVSGLAEHGDRAASAILPLLESVEAAHRWWAVRALAALPAPRTDWLLRGLADAEPEVRAAAALALASHPHESAISALVEGLSDQEHLVGLLCVHALAKTGALAVPLLIDAYEKAPQRGRILIMRALAEIRDPGGIKLMMAAATDDSNVLRYWANEGLERLGLNMVYLKPD